MSSLIEEEKRKYLEYISKIFAHNNRQLGISPQYLQHKSVCAAYLMFAAKMIFE